MMFTTRYQKRRERTFQIAHVVQIIGEKRAVFDDIHQTVANLSMHLECNQDTTSTRVV